LRVLYSVENLFRRAMRRGSEWRRLRLLPTNRDVLIVMVLLLLIVANASVRGTIARNHHLSKIEFLVRFIPRRS